MPVRKMALATARTPDKVVRQQLDRILGSRTFQPVDRLKRFLNFIVLESLAGRGDQLKEYVIAVQVFGKEDSFDPRTDPLVRVQARRLRARLVRYYRDEGQDDEFLIELPKGGYGPVFKPHERSAGQKRSMSATLAMQNSVAVLPFSDDSATGGYEYFCKGVREQIIHSLARVDALRVLAWDPATERVNAAMVITGSVARRATRCA